ncbi:MAG: T9SS type A sorting domain-containing protein [Ignavibacteriae bacterium]|nr:T9SS type A sorting domain-containing protein [Ignavibacteriota bacterium]
MFKKLIILFMFIISTNLSAQTVVLSDEFDSGDSKWNTGWIDASTTTVAVSIDNTGKLSGTNSYKIAVTNGGVEMWRVQRISALPLKAGYQYTISFMAVADQDNAGINFLFEIGGDPYTKRIDDTVTVTTTPQTYSFTVSATENVPDNFAKFMFGSARNNNTTIWLDAVVVTEMEDPTLISQWGLSKEYNTLWPILNNSATAPGDASMGGAAVSGWKGLQGGFGQDLTITTDKALVVKGQMEFVGADAGDSYTPIRYALTYQDSNTTLQYALTDSATWSHKGNHFGYEFTPRTGAGTMANGAGGGGTVWTVNNGNWASTWSNGGKPITAVNQAPRNAQIVAGVYDFAVSVKSIDDITNEIKWYMVEKSNKYWFGGTIIDTSTTKKFNSIIFGVNEVPWTEFKVSGMRVELTDPITVPEAPWQAYYVDQWGLSKEYNTLWPILNDSTTLVGDASIGGAAVSGWKGLQGGFGQDVEISTTKAIIVKGEIEFVGADAGDSYTPIRYALTYQDSNTTLQYALTDSATWSHKGNHFGYEFTPRTGAGTMANGAGGGGTVWTVNNGNWASTWSNGGKPIIAVNQAPRNAQIVAGTYNFAVSVQSIDATTNEIRWYMIEKNNKYWYGGTIIDTSTTKKFNSIIFGVNEVPWTEFKVIGMKVDKGDPITVPEAPWQAYYVDQWGLSKEYNTLWPILNDSTTLVGDASIGGAAVSGWKGLQGGFGQDVEISTTKAIIVKGEIEFVGADAGDSYTPIRYALTYQDSNTTLQYALTDSATWSHKGNHFGYEFTPRTGAGTMANGAGGGGTVWTVNNGNWASTWSNGGKPIIAVNQAPRNAQIVAGTYNFAVSVQSIDATTNEIRWYMIEKNNKYWYGGTIIDTSTTKKFNGIIFGVNEVPWTEFKVIGMKVDKGDPIIVPKAPWQDFYVDTWGIYGGNSGGWSLRPGDLTGNVDFNGAAVPTGLAAVRGDLGLINPEPGVDVFVLKGNINLAGGGFTGSASLRFGLFNGVGGNIAVDSTLDSSNVWTGSDASNNGYLMLPQEGTNSSVAWGTGSGTFGKIANGVWYSYENGVALGDLGPIQTAGGAGTYKFEICVAPKTDGTSQILWTLKKNDGSYYMEGNAIDNAPVTSFNSFILGIGQGATATSLHLTDIQATMTDEVIVTDIEATSSGIPTSYSLGQNYPNPFNPTTTIEFALPKDSEVKIVVYDILGREVANLIKGDLKAGYHQVNFNAVNFASGIYFYSIKAGDFTSTKKLVLMK